MLQQVKPEISKVCCKLQRTYCKDSVCKALQVEASFPVYKQNISNGFQRCPKLTPAHNSYVPRSRELPCKAPCKDVLRHCTMPCMNRFRKAFLDVHAPGRVGRRVKRKVKPLAPSKLC